MNDDLENKKIIIRQAKSTDAEQFINLIETVWRIAYKDIFSEEVFDIRKNKISEKINSFSKNYCNDEDKLCYVAEVDNKLVGVIYGTLNSTYEHFKQKEYADLVILYILPEFQGIGIATSLRNIFVNWVKRNGINKYVIGVLQDNKKARTIYEKWGGSLDCYQNKFSNYNVDEVFYTYRI